MPNRYLLFILLFFFKQGFSQSDSVKSRIWLVGDAGKFKKGINAQLEFIKSSYLLDNKTTILFLGDNIYPAGLPDSSDKNYLAAKKILDAQLNLVQHTEAKSYIIPGNHDWMQGKKGGLRRILNQNRYIRSLKTESIKLLPVDGCPGPMELSLDSNTVLVIMDTQWWLHAFETGKNCECNAEQVVLQALSNIVNKHLNKRLLFAAHHPFYSYGPHGGYFTLKQHIFPLTDFVPYLYIPLPILGSIYPLYRQKIGHIQDITNKVYQGMVRQVDSVLNMHPACVRLSGHEHTLQHITVGENHYIVSGAGSKSSPVKKGRGSLFSSKGPGVALLEIKESGKMRLTFFKTRRIAKRIYSAEF